MSDKNKKHHPKEQPEQKKDSELNNIQEELKKASEQKDALNITINNLNTQIIEKDKQIEQLLKQIEAINNDYVQKIQSKTAEANQMVKEKLNELATKANQELSEHKKYAIEKQACKLIEIVNQLELALSYPQTDPKIANYVAGFKIFLTMFKDLLNELHITEVVINEGDDFNPNFMEGIDTVPSDKLAPNKVVKVMTKCYKLHDRIIQVANVILSK